MVEQGAAEKRVSLRVTVQTLEQSIVRKTRQSEMGPLAQKNRKCALKPPERGEKKNFNEEGVAGGVSSLRWKLLCERSCESRWTHAHSDSAAGNSRRLHRDVA